jgi:hypothetical protein
LLLFAACGSFVVVAVILLDRFLHPTESRPEGPIDGRSSASMGMTTMDRMILYWNSARNGGAAPSLELPDVESGKRINLAQFRGRPVVLLFGSFTCDLFCAQARDLERLHQKFKDRAAFLFVYGAEPGHDIPELKSVFAGVDPGPSGRGERARLGRKALGMTMPTVLDSDDFATTLAYEAAPRRLVCVDKEGHIAFDAGRGVPGEWDLVAVERYLNQWLE